MEPAASTAAEETPSLQPVTTDNTSLLGNKRSAEEKDDQKKSTPQRTTKKLKKGDPSFEFRRIIQQCCATDDLDRAMRSYEDAVAKSIRIEAQSFYNLLNLCDGLCQRLHIGTPKLTAQKMNDSVNGDDSPGKSDAANAAEEKGVCDSTDTKANEANMNTKKVVDLDTRIRYAESLKERMDELRFPLTEPAFYALVKLYCRANRTVPRAADILTQAEQVQQCKPKLRLYAPLLVKYCEMGNMVGALDVWRRLMLKKLLPSEKEYTALIKCATAVGEVSVMERVLADLSEDVLVPSKETCEAICNWFRSPSAIVKLAVVDSNGADCNSSPANQDGDNSSSPANGEECKTVKEILSTIQHPYPEQTAYMGPVQCASAWGISPVAGIDGPAGTFVSGCLQGASLQPVTVSESVWQTIQSLNETIAQSGKLENDTSEYQGGRKGPKKLADNAQVRQNHWKAFKDFLATRPPIDVVIDGANVGYYGTNINGTRAKQVDYRQIDWVIQHFVDQNKTVLMVLHERHFAYPMQPPKELVQKWKESGVLYPTPVGMNDDWFWMHAAVVARALVVTNDEMRDHHFQMLAPRYFLRWKDRQQVHFTFGDWVRDAQPRRKALILTYPERYSRRIQRVLDGLAIPLPKRGDSNRFLDGAFVADDDNVPVEETYLCIRPKPIVEAS